MRCLTALTIGFSTLRMTARIVGAISLTMGSPSRLVGQGRTPPPALERFDFQKGAAEQVELPHRLREISGLAVTADGRLFAHGDEAGVVVRLNPYTGVIESQFSLGSPAIRDDFEGIAIAGERFFLITSAGRLYETREGGSGVGMPFTVVTTGFGTLCEIEGLAYDPSERVLLIGCKQTVAARHSSRMTIFRWSLDHAAPASPASVTIDLTDVSRSTGATNVRISGLELDSRSGHYIAIAGPKWQLVELTKGGKFVAARALKHRLHPQPEGITFLGDSVLLVADEGGKGRGILTRYHRLK
jgi:uncharacterized protein YjiK